MKSLNVLLSGLFYYDEMRRVNRKFVTYLEKNSPEQMRVFLNPTNVLDSYDAVFVFNLPHMLLDIMVPKGNVFAVMQEPGIEGLHKFMYHGLDQYDEVLSPVVRSLNTVASHGYLGWSDFGVEDSLEPPKPKLISIIASNRNDLLGHTRRLKFIKQLRNSGIALDVYGWGVNEIKYKSEGLAPYKFSVAIENSSKDHYFSEKIMDCFLHYTIPFYYGCANISKFFPPESYIWIDIRKPKKALDTIRESLATVDYEKRLPYLKEARKLLLDKYNVDGLLREMQERIIQNKERGSMKQYCLRQVKNNLTTKMLYAIEKVKMVYAGL